MKKSSFKKIVAIAALVFTLALIFATVSTVAMADAVPSAGRSFGALENIAQDKTYGSFPAVVEAWVKYPSATDAAGIIFSNYREAYNGAEYGLSFEIDANAKPRVLIDNGKVKYDIKFASIPQNGVNEWIHLAFAYDAASGAYRCYVNGAERGVDTSLASVELNKGVYTERPFMVGGSYERYNTRSFKGEIASLAVFTEKRSAEQIGWDFSKGIHEAFGGVAGLVSKYDFSGSKTDEYTDLSGCGFDLSDKMLLDESEFTPETDFAYSFAIIGDTQRLSEKYPEALTGIYQWIVDNAAKEKIEVVLGMGDITEQSKIVEWERAKAAVKLLEDAGIPYQLTRGNHDMKTTNPTDSERLGMNDVFGNYAGYMNQFEGSFAEGDSTNTYFTKKIGEVDYLFLALDYGASDAMLAWADEVVSSHPDHKVIVSTHGYEYYDGRKLGFDLNRGTPPAASNDYEFKKYPENPNVRDYNHGVDMWEEFAKKHGNIILILSGHEGSDDIIYHTEKGVHGNDVSSFLINPQGADGPDKFAGLGMVCLFKFSEDGREIYIEYYATAKEKYFKAHNQLTIDISGTYAEHDIERYALKSDADCESNAVKEGVCVDCGYVHTVEIEGTAHGHAVESYSPISGADCESNATEKGSCSICGKRVERERPNTAFGHDYEGGECKICHAPENEE